VQDRTAERPRTPSRSALQSALRLSAGLTAESRAVPFSDCFVRGGRGAGEVFARAGAGINDAGDAKLREGVEVKRAAFALGIGAEGAAAVGAFLPVKAEPMEVFEHRGNEFGPGTGGVEVFVTENEGSAIGGGALLGDPKGAGMAEVQQAGGRGCEAPAVRLFRKVQADYV